MTVPEVLQRFHARHPGASDQVFGRGRCADGRTSYDQLVDTIAGGSAVLDLACGDGALAARIPARMGVTVTGLDASEAELAAAQARLGSRATLVQGFAQALPFADGAFDRVVSHMALMLMDDLEQVLGEVARVLRPGGRLGAMVGGSVDAVGDVQRGFFPELRRSSPAPMNLGDPRTREASGWRELLAGWDDVTTDDVVLRVEVPAHEAWDFLELSYYPVEALPEEGKDALRSWLVVALAGRPLEWAFGMRRVRATRP